MLVPLQRNLPPAHLTIVQGLVEVCAGHLVDNVTLHTKGPEHVLEISSSHPLQGRIRSFEENMRRAGTPVRCVVVNDLDDSTAIDNADQWDTFDLSGLLTDEVEKLRVDIVRAHPIEIVGDSLIVNPQVTRDWITRTIPQGICVQSIDFPEAKETGTKDHFEQSRAFVCLACSIDEGKQEALIKFCEQFETKFGIVIIPHLVEPPFSPKEILRQALNKNEFNDTRYISKEHVPLLKDYLATTLRWRTPSTRSPSRDYRELNWRSYDCNGVHLREDIFTFVNDTLLVAEPDITNPSETVFSKKDGAFFLGVPTAAWVTEFKIYRGSLVPVSDPYRAIVQNKSEHIAKSSQLKNDQEYQNFKKALNNPSDDSFVYLAMTAFTESMGQFFERNGRVFFARRKSEADIYQLIKVLRNEGIHATETDLKSRRKLIELMRSVRSSRRLDILKSLTTFASGESLVTRDAKDDCSIKPQRGCRQRSNQWLLASIIDKRSPILPTYITDILDTGIPASGKFLSDALNQFDEQLAEARFVIMVIKNITYKNELLKACVQEVTDQRVLCKVAGMKRPGILIDGQLYSRGQKIRVNLVDFDTRRLQFRYRVCEA